MLSASQNSAQTTGKVSYPSLGLEFQVPNEWGGQEGDGLFLMGHNTTPGIIFVIPHSEPLTIEAMKTESTNGIDFGGGTQFKPTEALANIGSSGMGGFFDGTFEYEPARAFIIGMHNPQGNGITIIAVTSSNAFVEDTYKKLAMDVYNSVQFSVVVAAQGNSNSSGGASGSLADWKYQLGGTKLTYMESYSSGGGGYNMKTEIHLCQAGFFKFYDENFMSVGGEGISVYQSGNKAGHGEWKIVEQGGAAVLILSFYDGNSKHFPLSWGEESKLYLNGYRYFRTWEGDNAPNCN